eukprot:Tamp_10510.p1 GENE.Tamp_10510~~Tamp_10510.p1  ORF type:complete len:152 (+),score=13.62 Tamp_10510:1457-1912(+)
MDRVLTPSPFRWRIVDTTEILACAASRAFRFAFASSSQLLTVAGASSLSDDCSLNQGAPRGYTLARIQQSENFGSHSGDSMKLYETNEDFYTLTHTHQSKKIDEASEDFSKLGWASYQSARLFGPKATGTGESSINANDLQIPIIHDTVCI